MLGNIFSPENWSTWAIWRASDAPRESSSMCGARLLLHGSRAQAPAKAPSCSPGQGSCLGDGEGSQGDPQPREEGEHVPLPPARWAQVSRPGEHDHGRRLTLDRVPQDPHQPRPEPGAPRQVPRVASEAKSLAPREEGWQSPRLLTALLASQDSPTGICTRTSGGHVRPACPRHLQSPRAVPFTTRHHIPPAAQTGAPGRAVGPAVPPPISGRREEVSGHSARDSPQVLPPSPEPASPSGPEQMPPGPHPTPPPRHPASVARQRTEAAGFGSRRGWLRAPPGSGAAPGEGPSRPSQLPGTPVALGLRRRP
ncbi:formin-like protein 16 isoform X2 [Herpailurus yagouaroundi]|uniref:formin-like protein 16 isoform X2 n=1 Tax=Herpailurus yagouaroundi TaxID=1608482 RepID=UPI001AD6FAAD|nr:formin-like protein 16 isoform X2 [Puma yagouaroundi]